MHTLTGFVPSITLTEDAANRTPQRLDADVTFSANGSSFNGGRLVLSGLLAEDRVSVLTPAMARDRSAYRAPISASPAA